MFIPIISHVCPNAFFYYIHQAEKHISALWEWRVNPILIKSRYVRSTDIGLYTYLLAIGPLKVGSYLTGSPAS